MAFCIKVEEETDADALFRKRVRDAIAHPFTRTYASYPDRDNDCALIEDILVYLSKDEFMYPSRAQRILSDAKKVLTFIGEPESEEI